MPTLTCMRGFSGSGKSYRAAQIAAETDAVIVNRDQLRKMMLNSWWTGKAPDEDRVTLAEEAQVKALLKAGVSVVVDATHLNPRYLRRWARTASRLGAEFDVVDVLADAATCVERDRTRSERQVGADVIRRQMKQWPAHRWPKITADPPFNPQPVEPIAGLKDAIICDIDSTLAHIPEGGRSPYDYTRVGEDLVDPIVREIVNTVHKDKYVLLVSGRDDTCRAVTLDWLDANDVHFDLLYMRPTGRVDDRGNKVPDYIVKHELFNDHIRGKFNVNYVIDDRRQVVDTWRAMGLKVLDVAGNEF